MKKEIFFTFLTQIFVMACLMLSYKMAAFFLGDEGFAEYALSRRLAAFILPAIAVGSGVAIPRYIAYYSTPGSENIRNPDNYFIAGMPILLATTLVFAFIFNVFKYKFAFFLFGDSKCAIFILPITFMLIGLVMHAYCYSYFRGKVLMLQANCLQAINLGFVPVLAFIFYKNITHVLYFMALICILICIFTAIFIISRLKVKKTKLTPYVRELFIYGIQRVPGDFAMAALFALPAIFISHFAGLKEAGGVAFSISLLNMVGGFFSPLALMVLPRASQVIAEGKIDLLKNYIARILKVTLFLTSIFLVFFEIFVDKIIIFYLGADYLSLISLTRIIFISGFGYTAYISISNVINAYYIKGVDTLNAVISLAFFLFFSAAVMLFKADYVYIVYIFTLAIFLLSILTLLTVRKILIKVADDFVPKIKYGYIYDNNFNNNPHSI